FPDHHCIATLDIGFDLLPDAGSGAGGIVTDIDACPYLQQPGGKAAAQAGRGVVQNHDHHPRCPSSPEPAGSSKAGPIASGGGSGRGSSPADSTSSMPGMILASNPV